MTEPSDRTSTFHISEEQLEALDAKRRLAHLNVDYWARLAAPAKLRDPQPLGANDKQVAGTHYKDMGVQPWDVVDSWPIEQQLGYYRGGALKYVMRLGTKDEQLQEARKAGHYIEKLIEVLERANSQVEKGAGT